MIKTNNDPSIGKNTKLKFITDSESDNSDSRLFFENRRKSEQQTSLEEIRWLTSSEAALYLRVSLSSIKSMIYRGLIRPYKLGRRNRFRRDELDLLIKLPVFNQEV